MTTSGDVSKQQPFGAKQRAPFLAYILFSSYHTQLKKKKKKKKKQQGEKKEGAGKKKKPLSAQLWWIDLIGLSHSRQVMAIACLFQD